MRVRGGEDEDLEAADADEDHRYGQRDVDGLARDRPLASTAHRRCEVGAAAPLDAKVRAATVSSTVVRQVHPLDEIARVAVRLHAWVRVRVRVGVRVGVGVGVRDRVGVRVRVSASARVRVSVRVRVRVSPALVTTSLLLPTMAMCHIHTYIHTYIHTCIHI